MGYIYILTNPSFPDYVKLGYADNAEKRLVELNRSECIPFAFRIYATYETTMRLTDLKLHGLIDRLNPSLRAIDTFNGKPRKKEFYAMTKEDAYFLLQAIAEINDAVDKLKLYPITEEELEAEKTAVEISSENNFEAYFGNKNKDMISLYKQMEKDIFDELSDVYRAVTTNYISWKTNGRCFAEIHLYKNSIRVQVLEPIGGSDIGEKMPDNYNWTLNYRFSFDSVKELEIIKDVIVNSYNQLSKNSFEKEDKKPEVNGENNTNILPNGTYVMSTTIKRIDMKVVGYMDVNDGKYILKAGSNIAPETERYDKYKHLFKKLNVENNILKDDFICTSVSQAAMFVRGKSTDGWEYWKDKNGEYIDKYRNKKDKENN